jgi:hypothetical protein
MSLWRRHYRQMTLFSWRCMSFHTDFLAGKWIVLTTCRLDGSFSNIFFFLNVFDKISFLQIISLHFVLPNLLVLLAFSEKSEIIPWRKHFRHHHVLLLFASNLSPGCCTVTVVVDGSWLVTFSATELVARVFYHSVSGRMGKIQGDYWHWKKK